jgi:hypothetical protein
MPRFAAARDGLLVAKEVFEDEESFLNENPYS